MRATSHIRSAEGFATPADISRTSRQSINVSLRSGFRCSGFWDWTQTRPRFGVDIGGPNASFSLDQLIGAEQDSVVRGIGVLPVFAGLIGLLLLVGSLATTWPREGR
jgi:hypothetical protein